MTRYHWYFATVLSKTLRQHDNSELKLVVRSRKESACPKSIITYKTDENIGTVFKRLKNYSQMYCFSSEAQSDWSGYLLSLRFHLFSYRWSPPLRRHVRQGEREEGHHVQTAHCECDNVLLTMFFFLLLFDSNDFTNQTTEKRSRHPEALCPSHWHSP